MLWRQNPVSPVTAVRQHLLCSGCLGQSEPPGRTARLHCDQPPWYAQDGAPVQSGGTTFTLNNVTASHTVNVTFREEWYILRMSDCFGTHARRGSRGGDESCGLRTAVSSTGVRWFWGESEGTWPREGR